MEHYTRNTERVTAYCLKCRRFTEHRVDQGRKGPCLDPAHPQPKAKEPKPQSKTGDLFPTVKVCAECLGTGKVTYSHGYENSEIGEEPCPKCTGERNR